MMKDGPPDQGALGERAGFPVLVLSLSLFLIILLRTAWVCDDAYITFRTAENFLDGFGLRYNPAERVQSFTHPLWLFLLLPFRLVTGEFYVAALALSLISSGAALALLAFLASRDSWAGAFGLAVLMFSSSFVDYSTSGLENPLAYLLLAVFFIGYSRDQRTERDITILYMVASLMALTRMDLALLVTPALIDASRNHLFRRSIRAASLGLIPLMVWETFSLTYYGFLFPNTAYAKLGTGIGRLELIEQGGMYFLSSLAIDPITLMAIVAGFVWVAVHRERRGSMMMLGAALYLVYLLAIGGDFMAGRFFSPVAFVAVLVLVRDVALDGWIRAVAFGAVLVAGFSAPHPPVLSGAEAGADRQDVRDIRDVTDERAYYYPYTGLLRASRRIPLPRHPWAVQGLQAKEAGRAVAFRDTVGLFGYYAGPQVRVVDYYGLTDPLLARLPARADPNWRPGHFARAIPPGYPESLEQGTNALDDENLSRFYERLRLITQGPLFSWERWVAIVGMNVGAYSKWIDFEAYRYYGQRRMRPSEIGESPLVLSGAGLRVDLGRTWTTPFIQVGLDCDDDYQVRYLRRGERVGTSYVPRLCLEDSTVIARTLEVPEAVRATGYDVIWLLPTRGSRPYRVADLRGLR
jgi:arabinofuranosyltransferase